MEVRHGARVYVQFTQNQCLKLHVVQHLEHFREYGMQKLREELSNQTWRVPFNVLEIPGNARMS